MNAAVPAAATRAMVFHDLAASSPELARMMSSLFTVLMRQAMVAT